MYKLAEKTWVTIGMVIHAVLYPFIAIYLRLHDRTRVMIVHGGSVLLVKPWLHNGEWDLPGGGLHKHEGVKEGASREIREELNLKIDPGLLINLGSKEIKSGLKKNKMYYLYITLDEKPELELDRFEIMETRWVTMSELNVVKIQPVSRQIIQDYMKRVITGQPQGKA